VTKPLGVGLGIMAIAVTVLVIGGVTLQDDCQYGICTNTTAAINLLVVGGAILWLGLAVMTAAYGAKRGFALLPLTIAALFLGFPVVLLAIAIGAGVNRSQAKRTAPATGDLPDPLQPSEGIHLSVPPISSAPPISSVQPVSSEPSGSSDPFPPVARPPAAGRARPFGGWDHPSANVWTRRSGDRVVAITKHGPDLNAPEEFYRVTGVEADFASLADAKAAAVELLRLTPN